MLEKCIWTKNILYFVEVRDCITYTPNREPNADGMQDACRQIHSHHHAMVVVEWEGAAAGASVVCGRGYTSQQFR